jgi:hypothetical protein
MAKHRTYRNLPIVRPRDMRSSAMRAIEAYGNVKSRAEALSAELDETTGRHGVPVAGLPEDDSMVTVVAAGVAAIKR